MTFLALKTYKTELMGFILMNRYQFMAVCSLILNFLHISSQKWLVFGNYFGLTNFLPQLANFLHGYIRHIRDILQLCYHRCSAAASCNDELRPPDLPADKMSTCAPRLITTLFTRGRANENKGNTIVSWVSKSIMCPFDQT